MSCLLFHGPGALEAALERAAEIGRLLVEPFGADGLKVKEAREIVSIMRAPPIGQGIGILMVGPMDLATAEAQDALLKSLEEFNPSQVQPILWAHDAGAVFSTIRSRSLMEWCPFGEGAPEIIHRAVAEDLVRAALRRDYPTIIGTLNDKEREAGNRDLLVAVAGVLADMLKADKGKLTVDLLALWDSVRQVLRKRGMPSLRETLAALVMNSRGR